jgi:hypothetical protein
MRVVRRGPASRTQGGDRRPIIVAVAQRGWATNMNKIILRLKSGGWTAESIGTERASIIRLFGSAEIITGFTEQASAERVRQEIQRLNPDYEIMVQS